MKIFLNKPIPETGMQLLRSAEIELIQPEKSDLSRTEWLEYCKKADAILNVGKNNFDKEFFQQCPNVRAIALFSVGYDQVDITEATKHKVAIGNTPEVLSKATSDVAFLLMQMVSRRAGFNLDKVKNGEWSSNFNPLADLGQELYGKTLGVFGLGRIGFEMAKKCKYAFGMKIMYHNRNRNLQAEKDLDAEYVSFEKLIENADVLSVHANYTPQQKEIFNTDVFEKMKPTSIFINTARGGFQNETDLYHAIKEKKIWGAGLDVTHPEPMLSDSPLLDLPTVCVLPHIGSATAEARNGMSKVAAENIMAFTKNQPLPTCVNPEVYE